MNDKPHYTVIGDTLTIDITSKVGRLVIRALAYALLTTGDEEDKKESERIFKKVGYEG